MERKMNFCFKGNRDYVHGSDMFNKTIDAINENICNLNNIDFMIYKKTANNIILTTKNDNQKRLIFKFLYNTNNLLYGIETDEKVNCRYEYDESIILKNATLKNNEICLYENTPYSFIENTIALNKALLNYQFKDKVKNGKWFFTRLQLKKYPVEQDEIRLKFVNSFNLKLTKTEIYTNNESIGFIYFSLVRENDRN